MSNSAEERALQHISEQLFRAVARYGVTSEAASVAVRWLFSEGWLRKIVCSRCHGIGLAPGDIDGLECGMCEGTGIST